MQVLFNIFNHHQPSLSKNPPRHRLKKISANMADAQDLSLNTPSAQDWVYYAIKGVPVVGTKEAQQGPNRKVPVRQNIDSWSSDPENAKQVKLFVMALDRFQKVDPAKRESYFQIAGKLLLPPCISAADQLGIHGQPNVPWDEPIDKSLAVDKGYCTHNNILFPIWHRPYLVLYEVRSETPSFFINP